MDMIQSLINNALVNGEKATLIPTHRLQHVKKEIDRFTYNEQLNGFQKWIVNDLYKFDVPDIDFSANSILLIAIPHPFYAHVEFTYHSKKYCTSSPVMSDFESTDKTLGTALRSGNYHKTPAWNLPLKRLAVHSGFATYGKNNICYIDGMGSSFSFSAYFTDLLCDDEYWTDVTTAPMCAECYNCLNDCPTGAIQTSRFLIDNERCLSYLNERAEPFPEWLPKKVHHCVYDCLKCQISCPMNKGHVKHFVGPVQFTESETNDLLSGIPFEDYSDSFKKKARYLGFDQWLEGIARNIAVLIEVSDENEGNQS